jgi:metallo-beta-lactamase family protein
MKVTFLGANETVTGSMTLVQQGDTQVLVDCGLFQGTKNLRNRNWKAFPFSLEKLDAVILTHAHLDHSGAIPLLVKSGYKGPIYSTSATKDLCRVLLPDSGHLQEEEAKYAEHKRYSKKHPVPLPLYTVEDAMNSLRSFIEIPWRKPHALGVGASRIEFEFLPAGHLFGAASILVKDGSKSILFSGDVGTTDDPLTRSPSLGISADDVVIESTYGNRSHPVEKPEAILKNVIRRTYERGGVLLIPSFAVGRAQLILYYIRQLLDAKEIPDQPVYLNSPMATKASELYVQHAKVESKVSKEELERICSTAKVITTVEESIRLNEKKGPMIIVAASGMATGGRVLHHLKAFAGDPKNTILFAGFQAVGTRGDAIVHGADAVKIHGEYWPVRAEVIQLDCLSAHADQKGLLQWATSIKPTPRRFFVNHGEAVAADTLRRLLAEKLGVEAIVPTTGESFDLDDPIRKS